MKIMLVLAGAAALTGCGNDHPDAPPVAPIGARPDGVVAVDLGDARGAGVNMTRVNVAGVHCIVALDGSKVHEGEVHSIALDCDWGSR